MENPAKGNTATRGNRKNVSLLVRGNDGAIIHPRYLHASGGRIVGIALTHEKAIPFAVTVADFSTTQLQSFRN